MLMVGYINPHHPFDPPAPYSTMYDPKALTQLPGYLPQPLACDVETNGTAMKYEQLSEDDIRAITAAYYAMITEIDDAVSRLIALLREKNLYDNTMIIFTSDHGEYMGFHHMMLKCNHLYDPLARIPLLVKYPQHIHLPQNDTRLTENIDIAPTVLDVCGLPVPDTMQGRSLFDEKSREFVFPKGSMGQRHSRAWVICFAQAALSCSCAAVWSEQCCLIWNKIHLKWRTWQNTRTIWRRKKNCKKS